MKQLKYIKTLVSFKVLLGDDRQRETAQQDEHGRMDDADHAAKDGIVPQDSQKHVVADD